MAVETPPKNKNASMKTIDKAMNLLDFFLPSTPEWGLSDLSRAAGMDKVTAMRILNSLTTKGIIEQHPETRKYRLGTAVLRLARIREASFPVVALLQPILEELSERAGETSHASLAYCASLTTIAVAEPRISTRAFIDPSQPLPLHATASGLAYLANVDEAAFQDFVSRIELRPYTAHTLNSAEKLKSQMSRVQENGYAISAGTYQDDVVGIAAPIFDWHGNVTATLSAACVASRMTDENRVHIVGCVLAASVKATRAMGGDPSKISANKARENRS